MQVTEWLEEIEAAEVKAQKDAERRAK